MNNDASFSSSFRRVAFTGPASSSPDPTPPPAFYAKPQFNGWTNYGYWLDGVLHFQKPTWLARP